MNPHAALQSAIMKARRADEQWRKSALEAMRNSPNNSRRKVGPPIDDAEHREWWGKAVVALALHLDALKASGRFYR